MDKESILRAKIEHHKTYLNVSIVALISFAIAYWQLENPLGKLGSLIAATLFLFSFGYHLLTYEKYYLKLLELLRQKTK